MSKLKEYWPYLFTAGVGILGALGQLAGDKKTEKMIRDTAKAATHAEFDRLARTKHGGPRHTG